jgi:hypothetical protein
MYFRLKQQTCRGLGTLSICRIPPSYSLAQLAGSLPMPCTEARAVDLASLLMCDAFYLIQTDGSVKAAWASVKGERVSNVTGPTNR